MHHSGNAILSDLAGIYLLGISPGTLVHHNIVHDSLAFHQYGHGIYLDQASGFVFSKKKKRGKQKGGKLILILIDKYGHRGIKSPWDTKDMATKHKHYSLPCSFNFTVTFTVHINEIGIFVSLYLRFYFLSPFPME